MRVVARPVADALSTNSAISSIPGCDPRRWALLVLRTESRRRVSARAWRPISEIDFRASRDFQVRVELHRRAVGQRDHDCKAVGYHVVHLAGDPGPFCRCCEKRLLISLELESCGTLDQASNIRTACPDVEARGKGGHDEPGQKREGRKRRLVPPGDRKECSTLEDEGRGDCCTPRTFGGTV